MNNPTNVPASETPKEAPKPEAPKAAPKSELKLKEAVVTGITEDGRFYCAVTGTDAYNALKHVAAALHHLAQKGMSSPTPTQQNLKLPSEQK